MNSFKQFAQTIFLVMILLFSFPLLGNGGEPNISYQTETVAELIGRVTIKTGHGPLETGVPFGGGKKISYYILKLIKPINVKGDNNPKSLEQDDYFDVKEVALALNNSKYTRNRFNKYLNKKVTVKGRLYEKTEGWELTNVLMEVSEIKQK